MSVTCYRKKGQTKLKRAGWSGLLVLDDNGNLATSGMHQRLMDGIDSAEENYTSHPYYLVIKRPTKQHRALIMDRLFKVEGSS